MDPTFSKRTKEAKLAPHAHASTQVTRDGVQHAAIIESLTRMGDKPEIRSTAHPEAMNKLKITPVEIAPAIDPYTPTKAAA